MGGLAASLVAMERARQAALVGRDAIKLNALHAEDYQLITPHGDAIARDQYVELITSGRLTYKRFAMVSEPEVLHAATLAVLRCRVHIDGDFEGHHEAVTAWHTDCYRKTDAGWKVVWSQATAIENE